MTFSEYASGLYPFLSYGKNEAEYFVELIGHFLKDAALEACIPLSRDPGTQTRYVTGSGDRPLPGKYAKYIYENRDLGKYEEWLDEKMDESDSYDAVCEWLRSHGLPDNNPQRECAYRLETVLLSMANKETTSQQSHKIDDLGVDLDLIADIESKIKKLPHPPIVAVPAKATKEEETYIEELYKAYGDAENIVPFSKDDLLSYPDYAEDLDERRVDYYAAESIRRGVQELKAPHLTDQFKVLKDSTYDGVKDTERKMYPDGYERMLAVMEQSVKVPVSNYLLGASPYWISERIKKGVCHHLVNDGKLNWVKAKNKDAKK